MNKECAFTRDRTLLAIEHSGRGRLLAIGAVAAVVLILLITAVLMGGSEPDQAAAGAAGRNGASSQAAAVTVMAPGRSQVARVITASGTLAARRDEPVGIAGEGGLVTAVLVDAGAWVRQGQVLARIERSVQAQESARLAAQVSVARADSALAQAELERAQALVGRGFVSKADLDRKRAARDSAAARVRVAQAELGGNRARIGRLDIRAPSSGLILARQIEVGQIVNPGSGGLFRLARSGEMEMRAQLAQQDLALVRVGLAGTVTPIGSERRFAGTIWQVAPVIDPQSRQGEVRIALPYDPAIRPGGFAEARIAVGGTTAPLLPQSAVLSDERGNYVYVVNRREQVERRPIKVGNVDESGVTIAEGLTGQELVVLSAGPFLTPGQRVAPRRTAPPR